MDAILLIGKLNAKDVLINKIILVKWNCLVSMATHNSILKNGYVPTTILIYQQEFILEH